VPFPTWQRTACSASSAADNGGLNCIQFDFIDNSGNDALEARRSYNIGSNEVGYCAYIVEFGSDVIVDKYAVSCVDGGTFDVDLNQAITDIDKTFCVFYYRRSGGSYGNYDENCCSARILSASGGTGGVGQVRIEKGSTCTADAYGVLYVVEDTGTNFDVHHGDSALTQGTTNDDIIPTTDLDSSFLIASYHTTQPDDDPESAACCVYLYDSTHVRSTRDSSGSTIWVKYQVVTLDSGNVYRGLKAFTANNDQQTDGSFTAVDTDVSMTWNPCLAGGHAGLVPGANGADVCGTFIKTIFNATDTGVVLDRLDYDDEVATIAWEVVEWESGAAPIVVNGSLTTSITSSASIKKKTNINGSLTTSVTSSASVAKKTNINGSFTTGVTTSASVILIKSVSGSLTTGITTSASITKITNVEGSLTTAVSTSGTVSKQTAIDGSLTTNVTTDAQVAVVKLISGSSTTNVTTFASIVKTTNIDGSLTTGISTSASIAKTTNIDGSLTTSVSTVGDVSVTGALQINGSFTTSVTTSASIAKTTNIDGSLTTTVSTDAQVTKKRGVDGSLTTGVQTDASITKTTRIEGSSTTNLSTQATITKKAAIQGSTTTNISTFGDVTKVGDINVVGEFTTGVTTSASIAKTTSIDGSVQTNISTDARVSKETAIAGSATTGVSTFGSVVASKLLDGFFTTGVTDVASIVKTTNTIGAATTDIAAIGSVSVKRNIVGAATTAIQTYSYVRIPTGGLPMLSFLSIIADGDRSDWTPQPSDGTANYESVAPGVTPPDRSHWVFTDLTAKLDKYLLTNVPDNMDRINYMRMYFDFTGIDLGLIPGIRVQIRLDDVIFDSQKDLQLVADSPNTVMVEWSDLDYSADVFKNATKVELWMYSISAAGAPPPEDPDYIPSEQ
jgi:hypothetical protein